MPGPFTILIAATDLIPVLKEHAAADGEVLAFSDVDALRALEEIVRQRPAVVALERLFAATSRGAALINRIKADPALSHCEIRVVSHDTGTFRISPRRAPVPEPAAAVATAIVTAPAPPQPSLDWRGTRRAQRVRMADGVEVLLDGNPARLIDLSAVGAQVLSPSVLRPNQRVRIALADDLGTVRFNGAIAWASFEMPRANRAPQYRAGVEFSDADPQAVEAFAKRHRKK